MPTTMRFNNPRDTALFVVILNGYENIDTHFFSLKKYTKTREHEVIVGKDQGRLDIRN